MSEDNVADSSLGVESLSIKTEPSAKPAEIVKSKFDCEKIDKTKSSTFILLLSLLHS